MAAQQSSKSNSKRKHSKPKKGIRNESRPNGKAWKKGLSPEKRNK